MTRNQIKTKTTEQLKRWCKFYTGETLNQLLNELCERGESAEDC